MSVQEIAAAYWNVTHVQAQKASALDGWISMIDTLPLPNHNDFNDTMKQLHTLQQEW